MIRLLQACVGGVLLWCVALAPVSAEPRVFLDFSRTLADKGAPRELDWQLSSPEKGRTKVMALPIKTTAVRFPGEFCLGIRGDLPSTTDATLHANERDTAVDAALGLGTIDNLDKVRSWQITVLGQNDPVNLTMVLADEKGVERLVHFGELTFTGWETLVWVNPVSEAQRSAAAQHRFVFRGFEFTSVGSAPGLSWTVYIHDVRVEEE